ncbi:BTAD domain-containing putative transcriptional regulator [Frondihabitans sp. VKM Ac-2883]|uniref:ATP-binding protein n=1 Tax=Frondihabitans sp. VKM Ac-2883 TaxID=2783823 RepID=UPI00188C3DD1|nr:hypothetical protein [Frondihabitans sp. VKM Ac-2883]
MSTPDVSVVSVGVLGPLRVAGATAAAETVSPAGPRAKTLVVALTLAGSDGVTSARLIDDLWGDEPPVSAKAALQTLISRLRQSVAPGVIVSTPTGYRLGDPRASDLQVARSLLTTARIRPGADPATLTSLTGEALRLWRGAPGSDLEPGPVSDELTRVAAALRADLLRVAAAARCDLGDTVGALEALDELAADAVGLEHEDLVVLRMRILSGSGRRTEALQVFASYRERLADELGTGPSNALVALNAELLATEDDPLHDGRAQRGPGEPATSVAQPPRRGAHIALGLRSAPNELLGRSSDVDRIEALLEHARLVTILGPGGLGKTRLAQEVAHRAAGQWPRVAVVELAGVRDGEDVLLAVASALGVREVSAPRIRLSDPGVGPVKDRLVAVLAEMSTLLVLDNCEHVVDAAAGLVSELLAETSELRVVATSRSPLAIGAETVHPLGSLRSDGAAVSLFEQRARAARPGVLLPRDVVVRLCDRLDGLPLAIELAAARVRSLSVDEIERRLGNRFALLTSGDRSAPERHRTITAVIDWSWNLLGDDERVLLRRLSRFPDGFSADAAELLGAAPGASAGRPNDRVVLSPGDIGLEPMAVADALDGLVRQSLLGAADEPGTGRLRYRMLETVREFGDLRLAEAAEEELVSNGMFAWAEAFSRLIRSSLDGADQVRSFALMAAEQDDLVFVLRQALAEERRGVVATTFAALGYYWSLAGSHAEVQAFAPEVIRVLRSAPVEARYRDPEILCASIAGSLLAFGDRRSGLLAVARLRSLRASGPAQDPRLDALSGLFLATVVDPPAFRRRLKEALASGDDVIVELATAIDGQTAENEGRVGDAFRLALRAHQSAVANGHVWTIGTTASSLAELASQSADPEAALGWSNVAREALESLGAAGDLQEVAFRRAMAELSLGRYDAARRYFEGVLVDEENQGEDPGGSRLMSRVGLAEVALAEGQADEGIRLYDEALAIFRGEQSRSRSPLALLVAAAALAAHVRGGAAFGGGMPTSASAPSRAPSLANRLRTRLLATHRLSGAFEDVPIAGAAVFALGVWILGSSSGSSSGTASSSSSEPAGGHWPTSLGLRLLSLAETMQGRQEVPSLVRADAVAGVRDRFGAETVEAARALAALLTPSEAYAEALELLVDRRLRV